MLVKINNIHSIKSQPIGAASNLQHGKVLLNSFSSTVLLNAKEFIAENH